jgi:hypothetical protein
VVACARAKLAYLGISCLVMSERMSGFIHHWKPFRGFGFIGRGVPDLFLHARNCHGPGNPHTKARPSFIEAPSRYSDRPEAVDARPA